LTVPSAGPPFSPLFLTTDQGRRFAILHPARGDAAGAVLYVHPFGEEMNKSRRTAALQARALASRGFTVLQVDLYGCGDSDGDLSDASWDRWRADTRFALQWLRERGHAIRALWGLRLGALLALDAAKDEPPIDSLLLWQPVVSGSTMLTQFLRVHVAGEMLAESRAHTRVDDLRERLAAGETLEIAGYRLPGRLATAIAGLRLADLAPPRGKVFWFEVVAEAGRELAPASRRVVDQWANAGVVAQVQCVAGQPFWNTTEISECEAIVDATTRALAYA